MVKAVSFYHCVFSLSFFFLLKYEETFSECFDSHKVAENNMTKEKEEFFKKQALSYITLFNILIYCKLLLI